MSEPCTRENLGAILQADIELHKHDQWYGTDAYNGAWIAGYIKGLERVLEKLKVKEVK